MYIVLIGPPGAGKGTYAKFIQNNFDFYHFDTGKLLRESNNLTINNLINKGLLVTEDMLLNLLNKFSDIFKRRNIIFDGIPRDVDQAKVLDKFLENFSKKIDLIIELKSDEKILVERLLNRVICKNCNEVYKLSTNNYSNICEKCYLKSDIIKREDDKIDIIANRIKIYNEKLPTLKKFYETFKNYRQIDTSRNIEIVNNDLSDIIEELLW